MRGSSRFAADALGWDRENKTWPQISDDTAAIPLTETASQRKIFHGKSGSSELTRAARLKTCFKGSGTATSGHHLDPQTSFQQVRVSTSRLEGGPAQLQVAGFGIADNDRPEVRLTGPQGEAGRIHA